ncbi:hypothetical protein [Clostridium cellulovorans]|uniref:Uncharacterized protein n=1 Tax=Clostridium cellulovorans (strain ATCC 35296 / DSM 3052 / OCM 3 / 743B) TaxID=573061 RepID=D9SLR7_CLOC7|nr:hypothetical protein [Clostridium cellulovorans]ADL53704.1 hypothetical protein Clocel_4041 [Clostridium cellulovorans 743B]
MDAYGHILRGIIETILLVVANFVFIKKELKLKECLNLVYIFMPISIFIRFLPIQSSLTTIINAIIQIIVIATLCKIEVHKAIFGVLTSITCLALSEGINILFLRQVLHLNLENVFSDPLKKELYGIPSLILFAVVLRIVYLLRRKRTSVQI